MKILVLEDNENLSGLIKEVLEERNYTVHCFTDGEDALEHCCDGYDFFILDINVPGMDGLTLLQEIRDRDKEVPAIIISANIELETIKKAYIRGCNDFLKKPFYMYELEMKIEQLQDPTHVIILQKGYSYDMLNESLYDSQNKTMKLTKSERRFLTILTKHSNHVTSLNAIEDYVWEGKVASLQSVRSLVQRLRKKTFPTFILSHHYGYEIKTSCP